MSKTAEQHKYRATRVAAKQIRMASEKIWCLHRADIVEPKSELNPHSGNFEENSIFENICSLHGVPANAKNLTFRTVLIKYVKGD